MDKYLAKVHIKDDRKFIGYGDKVINILIFGDRPKEKIFNHLNSLKIFNIKIIELIKVNKSVSLEEIDEILDWWGD